MKELTSLEKILLRSGNDNGKKKKKKSFWIMSGHIPV